MKTYRTRNLDYPFEVDYASSRPCGYGLKEIRVILTTDIIGGKVFKEFESVTIDMYNFDKANDLEGQEKYEALFELIQDNIDHRVEDWIYNEL